MRFLSPLRRDNFYLTLSRSVIYLFHAIYFICILTNQILRNISFYLYLCFHICRMGRLYLMGPLLFPLTDFFLLFFGKVSGVYALVFLELNYHLVRHLLCVRLAIFTLALMIKLKLSTALYRLWEHLVFCSLMHLEKKLNAHPKQYINLPKVKK